MNSIEREGVPPITHMLYSGVPLNHRGGGLSEHGNISVFEIAQDSQLGIQKKVLTVHRITSWINENALKSSQVFRVREIKKRQDALLLCETSLFPIFI